MGLDSRCKWQNVLQIGLRRADETWPAPLCTAAPHTCQIDRASSGLQVWMAVPDATDQPLVESPATAAQRLSTTLSGNVHDSILLSMPPCSA